MRTLISSYTVLVLCGVFASLSTFAQDPQYEYQASGILLQESESLAEDENYEKAIAKLRKIPHGDTNFVRATGNIIYLLKESEKYDEALHMADSALQDPQDYRLRFFVLKIIALRELKRYEEAHAVCDSALTLFPYNHSLRYNKGVVYEEQKDWDNAIKYFRESLYYNFYSGITHLKLATLYAEHGETTKAMLTVSTALLFTANDDGAGNLLSYLEQLSESSVETPYADEPLNESETFEDIDLLIKNQVGLRKDYKFKSKMKDFDFAKHMHVMLSALQEQQGSGFWQDNYVGMYNDLFSKGYFDGLMLYMLQSVSKGSPQIQNFIIKNQKTLSSFVQYIAPIIREKASHREIEVDGSMAEVGFYFRNGTLTAIGPRDEDEAGFWRFYHGNGEKSAEGEYDAEGKRTGAWKWWFDNGHPNQEATIENGEWSGVMTRYYDNGALRYLIPYTNGKIDGRLKEHYANGVLEKETDFKNEEVDGMVTEYYLIGSKYYEIAYSAGDATGTYKEYFSSGKLKSEQEYAEGKRQGASKEYYRSGQLANEGQYEEGKRTGKWKWYFKDGTVSQEGQYKKGNTVGYWVSYYQNGAKEEEYDLDESSKLNGSSKSYDEKGRLISEEFFKKGAFSGIINYDTLGNQLSENETKRKKFSFENFYPDGTPRTKGQYEKGDRVGRWVYYHSNGLVSSAEFFQGGSITGIDTAYYQTGVLSGRDEYNSEGKLDGFSVEYHENGQISEEEWYVDGVRNGFLVEYRKDGSMSKRSYYLENELNGPVLYYDLDNRPYEAYFYNDDLMYRFQTLDSTGKVTHDQLINTGLDTIVKYHYNGQLAFAGEYLNGVAHGEFRWYYPSGKPETKGAYFNGNRQGDWKWYSREGNVTSEGAYENGQRRGTWTYYDVFGRKESTGEYNAYGNRSGEWVYYYSTGAVEQRVNYKKGYRHGARSRYAPTGELQFVRYYDQGLIIGYSYEDASGKLKEMIPLKHGNGKIEASFSDGSKSAELEVQHGHLTGTFSLYDTDGTVLFKAGYDQSMYQGAYAEYYANGKPFVEYNYRDDELDGIAKVYHDNGQVYSEINYRTGKAHGDARFYDRNGTLQKHVRYYNGSVIQAY